MPICSRSRRWKSPMKSSATWTLISSTRPTMPPSRPRNFPLCTKLPRCLPRIQLKSTSTSLSSCHLLTCGPEHAKLQTCTPSPHSRPVLPAISPLERKRRAGKLIYPSRDKAREMVNEYKKCQDLRRLVLVCAIVDHLGRECVYLLENGYLSVGSKRKRVNDNVGDEILYECAQRYKNNKHRRIRITPHAIEEYMVQCVAQLIVIDAIHDDQNHRLSGLGHSPKKACTSRLLIATEGPVDVSVNVLVPFEKIVSFNRLIDSIKHVKCPFYIGHFQSGKTSTFKYLAWIKPAWIYIDSNCLGGTIRSFLDSISKAMMLSGCQDMNSLYSAIEARYTDKTVLMFDEFDHFLKPANRTLLPTIYRLLKLMCNRSIQGILSVVCAGSFALVDMIKETKVSQDERDLYWNLMVQVIVASDITAKQHKPHAGVCWAGGAAYTAVRRVCYQHANSDDERVDDAVPGVYPAALVQVSIHSAAHPAGPGVDGAGSGSVS
ncbi:hypothetical protein BC937DRAFT_87064 [Endogone sp. FLAS-F59071]|nr:hypothetical protein BC937DRAFT_87064 [Endogone sp. FLAS-F59071]|eukprot:RUS19714.1 hypothetical protein BC937DRAFT_87064 [Endogone sp. FLAS-F59071]